MGHVMEQITNDKLIRRLLNYADVAPRHINRILMHIAKNLARGQDEEVRFSRIRLCKRTL